MPTTSIDTFFACSLVVVLVVSMMAALPRVLSPFIDGLAYRNDREMFQHLAQCIMLDTGAPSDWGSNSSVLPESFGLALDAVQPYVLDADKVTRLNSENRYAVSYAQLLDSLKMSNVAFRVSIQPLFDVAITKVLSVDYGNKTEYSFRVTTQSAASTVESNLSCYVLVSEFFDQKTVLSDSSGVATVTFEVPNSVNGNALLVVFAKAVDNPSVSSFGVFTFLHQSLFLWDTGVFARLSPLNSVLNVVLNYANTTILGAYVLSHGYSTNLTVLDSDAQNVDYSFPLFLDKSPMLLVLTGLNGTDSFAEWVAYPQIPLEIGVNFDSSTASGNVVSDAYVVAVNGVLYRLRLEGRKVG